MYVASTYVAASECVDLLLMHSNLWRCEVGLLSVSILLRMRPTYLQYYAREKQPNAVQVQSEVPETRLRRTLRGQTSIAQRVFLSKNQELVGMIRL